MKKVVIYKDWRRCNSEEEVMRRMKDVAHTFPGMRVETYEILEDADGKFFKATFAEVNRKAN